MKKRYLITALVIGTVAADWCKFNYITGRGFADTVNYRPEATANISKNSKSIAKNIYRISMVIAQNTTGKTTTFDTPVKNTYYSLQLGLFKDKKEAEEFLQKLPPDIKENSFIYRTDNGFYSVRYGLFDSYDVLKEIQKKLQFHSIIVKTEASKIIQDSKQSVQTEEKQEVSAQTINQPEKEQQIEKSEQIMPEFEEKEVSLFEDETPETPLYKKIAGALLFIPAYMLTHKQRGFWGKIEFAYRTENYNDRYSDRSRRAFRQYYELNYSGYVYSPRLASYQLNLNFTREDAKIDSSGSDTDTTVKLLGYGVHVNFLKSSRFPFTVFARRTESPTWYTYFDRTSYTERKSDTYGFTGSLSAFKSNIRYGYRYTKSKSTGLDFSEDRTSEEYNLSYGKYMKDQSLDITYRKTIDDYIQRYLTAGTFRDVYQDIDSLNMRYRWDISKISKLYANARYYSNSYSDNKSYTGNVNYMWHPSQKLNANFGLATTYSESPGYDIFFVSLHENINYIINDNWSASHMSTLFSSTGSTDQNLVNTGINLNYHNTLSEKLLVFAGSGISVQAETGTVSRVGSTVSANGGFNKRFDFLKSELYFNASASQYRSSKDDRNTTLSLTERYSAKFTNNLRFEHMINYYYQDSEYYNRGTAYSRTNYDNVEISNALHYKRQLGWKGMMGASAGVKYYYGKNRAERFYPYGNMDISYRFTRRLLYKLRASVHRDTYYQATYVRIKSTIDYKIRSVFVKFDVQYYQEDSDVYGKRENYITLFKIYRVF